MKFLLPAKTYNLVRKYNNLRIGPHIVACPYYQNVAGRKGKAVFLGKGLPDEIEKETKNHFKKRGKKIHLHDPDRIRFYMVMADIGIDCSGFAMRVLASFLKKKKIKLKDAVKPREKSILANLRHNFRISTNLSADTLTSYTNCVAIREINSMLPGDLLRVGPLHLAIITGIEKLNGKVKKITYHHATSDYLEKHGVRKGSIIITNSEKPLEKQRWDEYYQGRNWMLEDYLNANKGNQGVRRLKALINLSV